MKSYTTLLHQRPSTKSPNTPNKKKSPWFFPNPFFCLFVWKHLFKEMYMRKSLFTSSTALNQLKLMCNMLGRPEEASWFRGRRVFRGTCHPKNRGRRVFKWCALKVTSKIWWWILFWGWTIPLAVWQYLSTNRVLFYLQVHVEALVVEAKSTTMESAHQKCLGKCKSTHQENVHFTTELNLESLTLHETNSSPIKMVVSNRQVLFQGSKSSGAMWNF